MPCLSGSFNPTVGALIDVGIAPPNTLRAGSPTPTPVPRFVALLDTGAAATCIAPQIVQTLGLQPTGMRGVASVTQSQPMYTYLIDLVVPFGTTNLPLGGLPVVGYLGQTT